LKENEETVLKKFQIKGNDANKEEAFSHSYYQGLVVEIGNMKGLQTYVPPQDKNHKFLEKPLKDMTSLDTIYVLLILKSFIEQKL
jgi:hypothetical protein